MGDTPGRHRRGTLAARAYGRRKCLVLKDMKDSLRISTAFWRQTAVQR